MRESEAADAFYVIRRGAVALETFVPQRGPVTIETLHEGDLLGWSWLFPPYRTAFDARAIGEVHAIRSTAPACAASATAIPPSATRCSSCSPV